MSQGFETFPDNGSKRRWTGLRGFMKLDSRLYGRIIYFFYFLEVLAAARSVTAIACLLSVNQGARKIGFERNYELCSDCRPHNLPARAEDWYLKGEQLEDFYGKRGQKYLENE